MRVKKVIVATAVAMAAAAVYVGVAAAAVSPNPAAPGSTVQVEGNVTPFCGLHYVSGHWVYTCSSGQVTVYVHQGTTCTGTNVGGSFHENYDAAGHFSFPYVLPTDPAVSGYSFHIIGGTSGFQCLSVAVSAAAGSSATPAYVPPPPPNIFLCYSADQTQPGVWPQDEAAQLLQQGYWLPYAVSGDSSGGTNLGGYNLTCNIASTQSVSDSFVGGDGTELGPAYAGATIGLYPKVGG